MQDDVKTKSLAAFRQQCNRYWQGLRADTARRTRSALLMTTFAGHAGHTRPDTADDHRSLPEKWTTGQVRPIQPRPGQKRSLQWTRAPQHPVSASQPGPPSHKWLRTEAASSSNPLAVSKPPASQPQRVAQADTSQANIPGLAVPPTQSDTSGRRQQHVQATDKRHETSPPATTPSLSLPTSEQPPSQPPAAARQRMTRLGRNKLVRQRSQGATPARSRVKTPTLSLAARRPSRSRPPAHEALAAQPRLVHRGLHRLVLATAAAKAARKVLARPKSPRSVQLSRRQLAATAQSPLLRRLSLSRTSGTRPLLRVLGLGSRGQPTILHHSWSPMLPARRTSPCLLLRPCAHASCEPSCRAGCAATPCAAGPRRSPEQLCTPTGHRANVWSRLGAASPAARRPAAGIAASSRALQHVQPARGRGRPLGRRRHMKLLRMNGVVYRVGATGALQRQGAAAALQQPVSLGTARTQHFNVLGLVVFCARLGCTLGWQHRMLCMCRGTFFA